jgi:TetR/AcrR family transcriptional repressor of nem operon
MTSKGDKTKQRIIAEATKLVQKKGFEATSMSDLVEATGLQNGCLYFHFTGKDELLFAILEKSKVDFFGLIDGSLQGATPADKLENFLQGVIDYQKSMGFSGGCIFGNIASEMSDKDKRVSAFVSALFDEWIEKIRKIVQAAQKTGAVTKDIPADALARQIVMSLEGGIMLSRLEKSEKPLKDCLKSLKIMIGLKK